MLNECSPLVASVNHLHLYGNPMALILSCLVNNADDTRCILSYERSFFRPVFA